MSQLLLSLMFRKRRNRAHEQHFLFVLTVLNRAFRQLFLPVKRLRELIWYESYINY
jgi:hypothetical protein